MGILVNFNVFYPIISIVFIFVLCTDDRVKGVSIRKIYDWDKNCHKVGLPYEISK